MKFEIKKKVIKPLCIYSLAFSMLLPSVASLADLDINLGGYSVVQAAGIEEPTINKVFYDATSISGGKLHRGTIGGKQARGTIHVTLKDSSGNEKAKVSVTPKSGTTWKVDLPAGVTIAEGDTVTAYQEFDGSNSESVTANAEPSLAYNHKNDLQMPTGEIWIEHPDANLVNKDEQAEAIQMFNDANTAIAGDIKSVKFSIDGTDHAYYEVTYTDGSTSGKVEAPNLKIKTVTETSAAPTIEKVQVTDGQIIVTLEKDVVAGTKFYFIKEFTDGEDKGFCEGGNCKVDKSTSQEMSQEVSVDGKKVTFPIKDKVNDLKLGREFGIVVKEPHKFRSCAKSEPVITTPAKVAVRDPHKLTEDDKKAIDKAIRDANTVNGVSKLPDWTANNVPAIIDFDKDGNVKIIDPADVDADWEDNYTKFVPKRNADGSVKLNDGAQPKITIPAKDLLKNIKPIAPTVALSGDKKNITITPNEKDTDANSISVSYTGKDGSKKTTTATKGDKGWTIEGDGEVDVNGVITLPKDKVKGGEVVTAIVTDKGGVADDDKAPLTSDPGTLTLEETKADKVESLGGLDPVAIKKWVGDEIKEGFWKDGVKAKDDAKKSEVEELLKGATFEDVTEEKRNTTKEGDFTGKVKVTFDDGSEIIVEKQMLYVSNDVTSMERKDKVPTDALDVEFKLGEGVKVEDKDPNSGEVTKTTKGDKNTPVPYKAYKVKPDTDLSTYKNPTLQKTIFELIDEKADEGYADPVWKDSKNGENFVAAADNNVFTATATKKFKVTVQANGGTGDDKVETKKSGEKYTLPKGDTFTPPENQKFAGWLVGDTTTTTEPGTDITITGDTVIKASWKPIMVDVIFDKGEGSGSKDAVSVAKGSEYTLPNSEGFTAPKDKVFDGWEVDGVAKKVGDKITVNENTTVTAKYKPIMVDVSFDKGEGSGSKEKATVAKGSEYTLPDSKGFTAPKDKVFDGWEVNGEAKKVGDKITVNDNTIVTAKWKDKTTTPDPGTPGTNPNEPGGGTTPEPNPNEPQNPGQPEQPTVTENPDGTISVTPGKNTDKVVIPTTGKNGENPIDVVVEQDGKGKWKNENNVPGVNVDPDTGKTTIPANRKVDKNNIIVESKPKVKPEEPSYEEYEIPEIKIRDHYTPTFPVYVTVPKTEKVEKAEQVPVSLETHKAYIAGYEDNTLRAEGNITRAEAAAMVTRLAGLDLSDTSMPAFKDMQKNAWYFRYINAAVKAKMLDADNGMMRPNDKITRAEFAKMLAAIDKENSSVSKFDDIKGHRYEKEINKIYGNNRIEGYEDGSFRPDAYLTRAESAAFLNRMFNRIADKEAYAGLEDKLAKFKDFDASKWYYDEMVEATNSHELTRRGKASDKYGRVYEKWTRILPSDVK